jgi:hypothetical protein
MRLANVAQYLIASLWLLGCGGGGGGSAPAPAPAPTPPSTSVTFSSSATDVNTGDEIQLSWSTSNASSCSASGSWSGDKETSGNETLLVTVSGSTNYNLNCSSSSSSASQTVSVNVNPVLNAYAYIDGPTTFSGFYAYTRKDSALRLKSIEVDLDINDAESLFITEFRYSEDRFLGFSTNRPEQGLSFGNNLSVNNEGEQTTFFIPQVSEVFHGTNQILLNTDNTINPFISGNAIENFHADITLDFDPDFSDPASHDNIRMSVYAQPKRSEADTAVAFIGSSNDDNGYAYIYLKDKREFDDNATNLVTEADIFSVTRFATSLFTSYLSQPVYDTSQNQLAFRVKSNFVQGLVNVRSQGLAETLNGARFADGRDGDNNLVRSNRFAVKYLQADDSSNQRIFFKARLSNDCFGFQSQFNTCEVFDPRLYFFRPTKSSMHGLVLGGYFGTPDVTNVEFLVEIDD